jgi:hypothetical protein
LAVKLFDDCQNDLKRPVGCKNSSGHKLLS